MKIYITLINNARGVKMKQVLVYISFGLMTGLGIFMWNAAVEQKQLHVQECQYRAKQSLMDILGLGLNPDNDMQDATEALDQLNAYNRDCKQ